jgi:hypothetical protein
MTDPLWPTTPNAAAAPTAQWRNHAGKTCPQCEKQCAFVSHTPDCNGCGASLRDVPEDAPTENVMMFIVYGADGAKRAYPVSGRAVTDDCLVIDDRGALAPWHTNAIPTDAYVPDVTRLFANPSRGLALVRHLRAASLAALRDQLADADWRAQKLSEAGCAMPIDELCERHVVWGFNLPPSQYQLHLQTVLPPLMPEHAALFKQGKHFTARRFLPGGWLVQALQLAVRRPALATACLAAADADGLIAAVDEASEETGAESYAKCHENVLFQLARSHQILEGNPSATASYGERGFGYNPKPPRAAVLPEWTAVSPSAVKREVLVWLLGMLGIFLAALIAALGRWESDA